MSGKRNSANSPVSVVEVLAFLRGEQRDLLRQREVIDAIKLRPQLLYAAELAELLLVADGKLPPNEPQNAPSRTSEEKALVASLPKRDEFTLLVVDEPLRTPNGYGLNLHGWREGRRVKAHANISVVEGVRDHQRIDVTFSTEGAFEIYGFVSGLPAPAPSSEFVCDLRLPDEVVLKSGADQADKVQALSLAASGAKAPSDPVVSIFPYSDMPSQSKMPSFIVYVDFSRLPQGTQRQTVMLELRYKIKDQGKAIDMTLPRLAVVERIDEEDCGSLVICDFPEPQNASGKHAQLAARLPRPEELDEIEANELLAANEIQLFPVTLREQSKVWGFGKKIEELCEDGQTTRVYAMLGRLTAPPIPSDDLLLEKEEADLDRIEKECNLKAIVKAICGMLGEETCKEVQQEARGKVLKEIRRQREPLPNSYYKRIIANFAIGVLRREVPGFRQKRTQDEQNKCLHDFATSRIEPLHPQAISDHRESSPDENLLREELKEEVHAAINKLSLRQRETILMSYFEELSSDEIAQILKISRDNVLRHLSHARENLREHLREAAG